MPKKTAFFLHGFDPAPSPFDIVKKMQDWHKTDLKLTQKSLDVWISLDFHLGPPKTNFGIKKQ